MKRENVWPGRPTSLVWFFLLSSLACYSFLCVWSHLKSKKERYSYQYICIFLCRYLCLFFLCFSYEINESPTPDNLATDFENVFLDSFLLFLISSLLKPFIFPLNLVLFYWSIFQMSYFYLSALISQFSLIISSQLNSERLKHLFFQFSLSLCYRRSNRFATFYLRLIF